jgi:hypothetical protein
MPLSQATSVAPRRQPEARMVQSSARSRCLSTYGCPPITTRSSRAPDLPGTSSRTVRSVASATSSATPANAVGAAAARSGIRGFYFGQ